MLEFQTKREKNLMLELNFIKKYQNSYIDSTNFSKFKAYTTLRKSNLAKKYLLPVGCMHPLKSLVLILLFSNIIMLRKLENNFQQLEYLE